MSRQSTAALLAAYLDARPKIGFDWRLNNCCTFAAAWVRFATGIDVLAGLPQTPDARRARRLLARLGGIRQAWSERLSEAVLPTLARTGDLVLIEAPSEGSGAGYVVGICNGTGVLVLDDAGRHHQVGFEGAVCAWRVERVA